MRIIHRMLAAPLLCALLMLLLGASSVISINAMGAALRELFEQRFNYVLLLKGLENGLLQAHAEAYSLFTALDGLASEKVAARTAAIDAAIVRTDSQVQAIRTANDIGEAERAVLGEVASGLARYRKAVSTALDMATVDPNMGRSGMQTADDVFREIVRAMSQAIESQTDAARERYESAEADARQALLMTAAILVASLLLSIVTSFFMARRIAIPMADAVRVAGRVADGDLTERIAPQSADEVGQLLMALARMQEGLRIVIGEVQASVRNVEEAAHTMSGVASGVAETVSQQSTSLAGISQMVSGLTESVWSAAERTEAVVQVAHETSQTATCGRDLVLHAAEEVRHIVSTVDGTANSMTALVSSAEEISGFANVIHEIADQTNLLALNAAIEAARAGEGGRGFAVVADEVRKLAEKTATATSQIQRMIEQVQRQAREAAGEMGVARQQVESGVSEVESLRDPLRQLDEGAHRSLENLRELSEVARQQTSASTEIAQRVEQISQSSAVSSSAVERGREAAGELEHLARGLTETVARFRC
ncbi:methyl-accepting chemotaxis protein [Uliginosibacterium sp. 31-12]|uniref:methyl-accepting chemotaxis protein n=1 Tax=Uliginosibacterium sp. 31-12 TaxID=3062781 RepID=UPI0026E274A2|nr:methyl-accepting chemotaxis protein [Uliginosibacterium sp. 31-12]MDO6385821.1 methyl-accepting chemotaxis protein [Uliginosibacterium sp. 31-12]